MPETSAMNSESEKNTEVGAKESVANIKEEVEVKVKPEPVECMVCVGRSGEALDVHSTHTTSGSSLYDYLCKFTQADLSATQNDTKFVCKTCFELINVLETAELEYMKLKETFESIISKNPLFDSHVTVSLDPVKNEATDSAVKSIEDDSEDEPLALTKKKRHRKVEKRKKPVIVNKRKVRSKNSKERSLNEESWECDICGVRGESGGPLAGAAHALVAHAAAHAADVAAAAAAAAAVGVVKKEDPERSQSPSQLETVLKLEEAGFDDDDDYVPEPANGRYKRPGGRVGRAGGRVGGAGGGRKKREAKVVHQCDQCNAKYTSLLRLEQHKLKHEDAKPPYICEVCGAHYKHKRACDIHVAMHKGISDWKCEECNKLFPSKGALQRHNNIHTGKLNYQCDLCGKSFIHTSSFKMHKLSHSGVKPHACDVCGLALMTRSHLKRHKRVHSGEKRHECAVCGKRFSERYNLLAHGKAHEGEAPAAPAAAAPPRRRLFRCGFCQERFERRYLLERHMGAAHGRALERPPPTPRNTMSKLLKAQALRREPGAAAVDESKMNRSPESRAAGASLKLASQLSSSSAEASVAAGWAGAYVAEFGLRPDYSH